MNSILIIGPLPHKKYSYTYGGATIAMHNLVDYCDRNDIGYGFIQTNYYVSRIIPLFMVNLCNVMCKLIRKIKNYDVIMLNVSSRGALYSGPVIYAICKLFRKKTVFRKFGGAWDDLLDGHQNVAINLAVEYLLKSDLILVETKMMVKYLHEKNIKNILWFPNVRRAPFEQQNNMNDFKKKFVFISQVTREKGILEIIKASDLLPSEYTIDIYGPIKDNAIPADLFLHSKANYKGALMPGEVTSTLKEYDVLILPTYYKDEGYPGIIIEALSLGIPVISTRFRSIPEIIDEKNGILVEPKDHLDLHRAILSFNQENFGSYRRAALKSFSSFNEDEVYAVALNAMYSL